MWDKLIGLATEKLSSLDLDNETGKTVIESIVGTAKNGDIGALKEMLSGDETPPDAESVNNLLPVVTQNLSSKLGVGESKAKELAVMAIPVILNMLNKKVSNHKQQNAGFDIGDLLSNLGSGGGGGLLGGLAGKLGGIFGNKKGGGVNPLEDFLKNLK